MAGIAEADKENWLEYKKSLALLQLNLEAFWDALPDEKKGNAKDLKTALRLATYVTVLFNLRAYPVNVKLAINKAEELAQDFILMGTKFEAQDLARIQKLVQEFENAFSGPDDALDYVEAFSQADDPAGEDDERWAVGIV